MKRWSLNAKIYSLIGIMIFTAIMISFLAIGKLKILNESMHRLAEGPVKRQKMLLDIQGHYYLQIVNEKNYLLAAHPEEKIKHAQHFEEQHALLMQMYNDVYPQLVPKNQINIKSFMDSYDKFLILNKKIKKKTEEGHSAEAIAMSMKEGRELRLEIEQKLKTVMDFNIALVNRTVKESDDLFVDSRMMMISTSVVAILISLVLAFLMLKAVGNAIAKVIEALKNNSSEVTNTAENIAASSEELSQATTEQSASLVETAASIEEMSTMVQNNAENARKASEVSARSSSSAKRGKEVVNDMIKAIDDISLSNDQIMLQINKSNQQISDIVKVISDIGNKTQVINEIVFQTKLLSFNASVEAARAGEHGKGFSVVAEEVGNLAQMSGRAAEEITIMLDSSIKKVEGIVLETKTSVDQLINNGKMKINTGTKIAHQCSDVLEEIVENVNQVTGMANEISNSCREQSLGVQEINRAMNQLEQVTQINAASSVQAASAAGELSNQASSMRVQVNVLFQTVMGDEEQAA